MKKRRKLTALILVCLLLPGISGCARQKTEVMIPVSVRIQDWRAKQTQESLKEATGQDISHYSGGYDFQYDKNHVLQKITVVGQNEEVTNELIVTADEEGRILSLLSAGETAISETYIWTSRGNLLTYTRVDGKGEQVLHREYDTKNRILSTLLTAPGKENVIAYEYSKEGLLRVARHYDEEALLCRTEYTHGEDGRLATETLYDAEGRINATAVYEYRSDGSTRITVSKKALIAHETITNEDGSTTVRPITPTIMDIVTVYTYDKAGFLIEEDNKYDDRSNMRYEYTYTTISLDKEEVSRIVPLLKTLPAMGILDQLTF